MPFIDRVDAGRRSPPLEHLRSPDVVVVGLPRGGVPVAFEVARALGAPLDVIVVRKLGVPVPARARDGRHRRGGDAGGERAGRARGRASAAEELAAVEAQRARRARAPRATVPG